MHEATTIDQTALAAVAPPDPRRLLSSTPCCRLTCARLRGAARARATLREARRSCSRAPRASSDAGSRTRCSRIERRDRLPGPRIRERGQRPRCARRSPRPASTRPRFESRVAVVDADLSKPALGLDPAASEALADRRRRHLPRWRDRQLGAAVCAAEGRQRRRHAGSAAHRRPPRPPFHFVSSLSVCYSTMAPLAVDERYDALADLDGLHLGYAQTKAVAEALVREAGRRGLPVSIYRPSLIAGHSETGAFNSRRHPGACGERLRADGHRAGSRLVARLPARRRRRAPHRRPHRARRRRLRPPGASPPARLARVRVVAAAVRIRRPARAVPRVASAARVGHAVTARIGPIRCGRCARSSCGACPQRDGRTCRSFCTARTATSGSLRPSGRRSTPCCCSATATRSWQRGSAGGHTTEGACVRGADPVRMDAAFFTPRMGNRCRWPSRSAACRSTASSAS